MATMKKLKKKDRAIEIAPAPRTSSSPIKRDSGEAIPYMIIMTLIITIYMATDIIESSVLDFNAEIHKSLGPEYNLDMFNPLQDCLKKAQQGLEFLNANSPYMKRDAWGDQCDNMYTMLRHKAAAVISDFLKHSKQKRK